MKKVTLLSMQYLKDGKTVVEHIALCTPKNKVYVMQTYTEAHLKTPKPAQKFIETEIELDTMWLVAPKIPQSEQ